MPDVTRARSTAACSSCGCWIAEGYTCADCADCAERARAVAYWARRAARALAGAR